MKIIDFEIKGNQVKFYLGSDNCDNYWGDDWDDKPYEHNAGEPYDTINSENRRRHTHGNPFSYITSHTLGIFYLCAGGRGFPATTRTKQNTLTQ